MRVSVIVPLYNKARYIVRALDSIAAQTFGDLEIVIVDDGSTDDGPGMAARHSDIRKLIVRQSNAGPGAARNRGLELAKGDLVAFLDADDEWMPTFLEDSVRLLDNLSPEVAAVTSGYVDLPAGVSRESLWRGRGLHDGVQTISPRTSATMLSHMVAYMSPCSTVARTAAVRRYGGYYDKTRCTFGEDGALWLKVLLNYSVYFQMRPLVRFHRDASELSGNYTRARPIEPFLADPCDARRVCPEALLPLLLQFHALRACKTASVLGYWGEWHEAWSLFQRFISLRDWSMPYFATALLGCTPLAGVFGRLIEAIKRYQNLRQKTPAASLDLIGSPSLGTPDGSVEHGISLTKGATAAKGGIGGND